jgi:hypothetical protein
MLRRLFGAAAAATLIASLSISSAAAAPDPAAVLRASFQGYFAGGAGASYSTFIRRGNGWYYAASTGIDLEAGAARISMTGGSPDWGNSDPEEHCSSNLFGIWGTWIADKAGLAEGTWQMSFGPAGETLVPLAVQRTAIKAVVNPQDFLGLGNDFKPYWQSTGIPVYGRLTPGAYRLHVSVEDASGSSEWDNYVKINAC